MPERFPSWQGKGEGPSCIVARAGFLELDPVLDGFSGVLLELVHEMDPSGEERYLFKETAAGTGNRLLSLETSSKELACLLFEYEMEGRTTR